MKRRSLSRDVNDHKELHSPAWREAGAGKEDYGEVSPFFFSRFGTPLFLEGAYRGASAFLIANGPSLAMLDLSPLKQRWAMTLNNGTRTFRGNANCTVDQPSRFSLSAWLDPTILKFAPMSQFDKPLWDNRLLKKDGDFVQKWCKSDLFVRDCPNIVGYRRNEKFHAPRWMNEETINWGNHKKYGGGRSVMLAAIRILYILGFRSIYLLGVDFHMSKNRRYHFPEGRTESAINGNMSTYESLNSWFSELQPIFLKKGFHVFNCNPESHLEAFPKISFEEALESTTQQLGLFHGERTEGMYMKLEEKLKALSSETTSNSDES